MKDLHFFIRQCHSAGANKFVRDLYYARATGNSRSETEKSPPRPVPLKFPKILIPKITPKQATYELSEV